MSIADKSVAIVAAVRTPVGSFNGALVVIAGHRRSARWH